MTNGSAHRSVCRERQVDSSGCEPRPVTGRSNRKHLERFKEVTTWTEAFWETASLTADDPGDAEHSVLVAAGSRAYYRLDFYDPAQPAPVTSPAGC